MRTSPGETNLLVTNLWSDECYFRLGTLQDSDLDGFTDALEALVAHTSPLLADSDGDGIADALEIELGSDPRNPFSLDVGQASKDGEWFFTAHAGQAGKRVLLSLEDYIYDPEQDVTYLLFSISNATPTDQFHLYIRTPSSDNTDTNWVWQNMAFKAYQLNLGYDLATSTRWLETAWWGYANYASFVALDSLDRDFDGLQDGYEILAAQTIAGTPISSGAMLADGDASPFADGLSLQQKWQYGLNPATAVSTQSTFEPGIPDWLFTYVSNWFGIDAARAWVDADGDGVPNTVELDIGSDPAFPDYGGHNPPPPVADAEFVSLLLTVPYSQSQSPSSNAFFTTAGFSLGPLGLAVGLTAIPSSWEGGGIADVRLDITPVHSFYNPVWPFSEDGTPTEGELQRPDPDDGTSYRALMSLATTWAEDLWGEINQPLLQALRQRTLEYASATTKMSISYRCREIQWLEYQRLSLGNNHPGIWLRVQHRASFIHTEMTKTTAIHLEYVDRYPTQGLRYAGKVLRGVQWLSFAVSLPEDLQSLRERITDWQNDVRLEQDTAGPALLSIKIQEFISSIPGMPAGLISTTTPIFDPCPLGFYEGGGGGWEDCLWPY